MTLTVADLVTVFGPMFATLLAVVVTMMRYQHIDGNKTRELMHKLITDSSRENREYADKLNQETRDLIKGNREAIKENRELIADSRERLSSIEGFLRLWPAPPSPPEDGDPQAA